MGTNLSKEKIDAIKEELDEAHTTGISHLEFIKKLIMDF